MKRLVVVLALAALVFAGAAGGQIASPAKAAMRATLPTAPDAITTDPGVVDLRPNVVRLPSGVARTTYAIPGGETIVDTTPRPGFDPVTASSAALNEYDFPQRPGGGNALRNWEKAMEAFRSDSRPKGQLTVDLSPSTSQFATVAGNWAGFSAGQSDTTSHFFVGVQADTTVPSADGCTSSGDELGAWIGLGGTGGSPDGLVQQGEECGTNSVSADGGFRPFQEFADPGDYVNGPVKLCGDDWVFSAGDLLYQQMTYETSSNKANFFLEDETSGVAHSCTVGAPLQNGWGFNGNTGDFIVETPEGTTVPFSTIHFTHAQVELNSDGDWVAFGSRPTTKYYDGRSTSDYCAGPSTIGSDNESFSVSWSPDECSGAGLGGGFN